VEELDEVEGSAAHLLTSALPPREQRYLVAKRDRYEEGVRSLIAAGVRSGEFVSGEPALAARAMLGALNWSVQWFRTDGPQTATEIAEGLADYLIRGLSAKQDAHLQSFSDRGMHYAIRDHSTQNVKSAHRLNKAFKR